jgi:hypothetical protein
MSGPWDRPSEDREPFASGQDAAERRDAGGTPGDGTQPTDPWSDQRPGSGSGWDDWSTLSPPDDFVLEEPVSTLGDPWSESWGEEDEAADQPAAPAPSVESDRWPEPGPDRWAAAAADRPPVADLDAEAAADAGDAAPDVSPWSPVPVAEPEPTTTPWEPSVPVERSPDDDEPFGHGPLIGETERSPDPWGEGAPTEPAADAEPVPEVPRVAPWQASDDPWGAVVQPEEPPEPETDERQEVEQVAAAPPGPPEPEPSCGGWRRELLPAWLSGRTASVAEDEAIAAEPVGEIAEVDSEPVVAEDEPAVEATSNGAPAEEHVPAIAEREAGDGEEPAAAESPEEPIGAVAWEDDAATEWGEPVAAGEPGDGDSRADVGEGATAVLEEEEAAAELETAAASGSTQAWPEADVVPTVPAPSAGDVDSSTDAASEEGDRRFDAWLGAPAIGSVAAGAAEADLADVAGSAPASDVAEGAPAAEEAPVLEEWSASEEVPVTTEGMVGEAEDADATAGLVADDSSASDEPAELASAVEEAEPVEAQPWEATPDAEGYPPADEAWVAEPEAWEPAASAVEPALAETPADEAGEAGPSPWAAAAGAGAAAGAARVDPEAVDAAPSRDAQPTWRPEWLPDLEELEPEEGTRVLPTDWTPPPVAPEAIDRGTLEPHATTARTRPAADLERELDEEGEPGATTAEQAVPWLIGFILLLAGMVIVLLALIFAGDGSLGGGSGQPTPAPSLAAGVVSTPGPSPTPAQSAAPSASPGGSGASATPVPSDAAVGGPEFGPIELVFQGRAAALAPIYLLHREFTTQQEPSVLAQDPNLDVRRYAWAMDGTLGAGLYADLMVSVEPGVEKRQLADGISAVTFGPTTEVVYAVRVTQDGANDVAAVLAIDYASGDTTELARLTYERPPAESRAALKEAQYQDEGGQVRLFWMEDNQLRLWVLNGGMWEIDPEAGEVTELSRRPPILWAPDGRHSIVVTEADGTSTLTRVDVDGNERGTTTVEGIVSHIRWSPQSDRIVFTLGRSASGGGVLQDLYLWDLGEEAPTQVTATGAAFGAEWMGSRVRWREDPGET